MDPRRCIQDVLRCHHCNTPVSSTTCMHCDICNKYLCSLCVGKHLSDETKEHKVVTFEKRGSTAKCPKHSSNISVLYCQHCDVSICAACASSGEHKGHKFIEISKIIENKKQAIKNDLEELEKSIYPKYQEIASILLVQKDGVKDNSKKIITALDIHREDMHKEIDTYFKNLKSVLRKMDSTCMEAIHKHEDEISLTISKITQSIAELNTLLNSYDVSLVSAYKSRNAGFKKLPPKLRLTLPNFTSGKINKDQLYKQIGSLLAPFVEREEQVYVPNTPGAESSTPDRPLIDEPKIITELKTKYGRDSFHSVSCLSDEEIWTCGRDKIMRLYNLQGEMVKSVQTLSGNNPWDIAITRSGDLIYTDFHNRTVYIVKYTEIKTVFKLLGYDNYTQVQPLITLSGWKPLRLCGTSSDELLVVLMSDCGTKTKVVRYSGSTEKQSIQFNDKGQPLYSPGLLKYVSENRNLDICVSDYGAGKVVVVNKAGDFRFSYTGPTSLTGGLFNPVGITTDSQGRILTSAKDCIHIVDQDGQFLRYIDNCGLQNPYGLCVDTRDNLFVAEYGTGLMKRIQFVKQV